MTILLQVIEIENNTAKSGYYKIRLENRERLLLTRTEYDIMLTKQLVEVESTSGNFYNSEIINSIVYFTQLTNKEENIYL